ncbi:MAG: hypothetical protein KJS98_04530 [Nitrospirae bacterium]|nr:hypothetical protein [Nitrospirota bacterium]MDE3039378.1 hypothetical protein [Nitrospirota bacterium]MDE3219364.1 hypothetical protein [Nitrospirota bacterium]
MTPTGIRYISSREQTMQDRTGALGRLEQVVSTPEEFERVVSQALPILLERATNSTKRFLRETGQWCDDVAHEKFALRWGAEYLEQFFIAGRSEVPCRPLFLLDAVVAKQHSRPEPFCYHPDLLTPLGRLIDGLVSRAAISRDALIAVYYHCFGLGPGQVITVLGLTGPAGQRIYKNFKRWRDSGWQRTMDDMGITECEVQDLCSQLQRHPQPSNSEAERIIRIAQSHYRKSEPDHYPCLSRRQWEEMFLEGYGSDYRIWHLALCLDCFTAAWDLGFRGAAAIEKPRVEFHVRP